jgi:hypothetical protein
MVYQKNQYSVLVIHNFLTYVFTLQVSFFHRQFCSTPNIYGLYPHQPTVSVSEENKIQIVVILVAPLFELMLIFIINAVI